MAMLEWSADPEMPITEDRYLALPEEAQRSIEVVGGRITFSRNENRHHNRVARRLADRFDAARPADTATGVLTGYEMRYTTSHPGISGFSFRRPDVIVYRCFDDDRELMTSDVLLVAEVVPSDSRAAEIAEKYAEYAHEGIRTHLVVHLDADRHIETIREYRLDRAGRTYRLADTHQERLVLTDPFPVAFAFADLDARIR
ncbi:Uma2 family endonuclease [Nocardia aurantia]|uniref:Putative restriction endonuclease domain-containing protein n=1 Tax=Nocardia aurantia TaxID=2585199 RepID=A0A7K0DHS4_9NOCA|nr:Uma2 family endonuclease [Nocardia aurantia]MQY25168.1 hypothetical protein [Nocardia aurantia]